MKQRFFHVFCSFVAIADEKRVNEESRLFEDLFVYNKYDNSVRPVRNKTRPVQVNLDVALVQLIDLVSNTPFSSHFYSFLNRVPHQLIK